MLVTSRQKCLQMLKNKNITDFKSSLPSFYKRNCLLIELSPRENKQAFQICSFRYSCMELTVVESFECRRAKQSEVSTHTLTSIIFLHPFEKFACSFGMSLLNWPNDS